ncbi:MAG: sensor histidine kinase [Alphaproteobacteria bacterium]|nr:sensor histidine kinase [Alphaproteobacteria bacterium]
MAVLGRVQGLGATHAQGGSLDRVRLQAMALLGKLSMHHVLFVAFTLVAAVPVLTLAGWVEHRAVQQEIDAATDKHLLVARNLTAAFSRYVFDVKAGFNLAIATFYSGEQAAGLKDLLTSLEFRHICIVDANTGEVERYMPGFADAGSPHITLKPQLIAEFRDQLKGDQIVITDLRRDPAGHPAFFLLKALPDGRIAYGVIGTNYLIQLQQQIAFGSRGHAAVIDPKGKIIAHPFKNWIEEEFDISKTPPAQAIMAGKTGVMQFYSPAFKANMITAYTPVPETHWGVMVPQPMEELYARADEVRAAATAISFLGLLAAALISWSLAKYIARPIQAVGAAAGAVARGNLAARAPDFAMYVPRELHRLSGSFNHMIDEISQKNVELANSAVRAEAANRAKSEFLANMSHELRTPLNAILGFSEVMRDEVFGKLNQRYQAYANDINNSAAHLIKVITEILDLSKAEAGAITPEKGPVRLPEVFDLAMRLVEQRATQGQLSIEVSVDSSLERPIDSDQGKITQILLNLLSNAVKFTKPGGAITLSAQLLPQEVRIAVCDNGIGIAEQDLLKVMTPFGQVGSAYEAHEGFGLGLPLSKKLAEAIGGTLSLDSVLGQGTVAALHLPRVEVLPAQEFAEAA